MLPFLSFVLLPVLLFFDSSFVFSSLIFLVFAISPFSFPEFSPPLKLNSLAYWDICGNLWRTEPSFTELSGDGHTICDAGYRWKPGHALGAGKDRWGLWICCWHRGNLAFFQVWNRNMFLVQKKPDRKDTVAVLCSTYLIMMSPNLLSYWTILSRFSLLPINSNPLQNERTERRLRALRCIGAAVTLSGFLVSTIWRLLHYSLTNMDISTSAAQSGVLNPSVVIVRSEVSHHCKWPCSYLRW